MAISGSNTIYSTDNYFSIKAEWSVSPQPDNTNPYYIFNYVFTLDKNDEIVYPGTNVYIDYKYRFSTSGGWTTAVKSINLSDLPIILDRGSFQLQNSARSSTRISFYCNEAISGTYESDPFDMVYNPNIDEMNTEVVVITNFNNFNDEENPIINYRWAKSATMYAENYYNNNCKVYAAISLTGAQDDVTYREITKPSTNYNTISYTFNLTDAERQVLRAGVLEGISQPVRFYIKTHRIQPTVKDGYYFVNRTLNLLNAEPTIDPSVVDSNAATVALTGNNNTFIKYMSNAAYTINAQSRKAATISSRYVNNGGQTLTTDTGTIAGVTSNTFYFGATDSRNVTTRGFLVKTLIPYIQLTCAIKSISLNKNGKLTLVATGNYYNGSLGTVNNTLSFRYNISENGGAGTWYNVTAIPTFDSQTNTYELSFELNSLNYRSRYTLIINAIDRLMNINSDSKTATCMPVFDWSKDDFRHRTNILIDDGKKIQGIDSNDNTYDIITTNNNNAILLNNTSKDLEIKGNNISIASEANIIASGANISITTDNPILINGRGLYTQNTLWSGAYWMTANQTISLTNNKVSDQPNGIILIFSLYRNGAAENVSIHSFFISKQEVTLLNGAPHTFLLGINNGFSIIGSKYLYINDDSITGHSGNISTGSSSGITFDNSKFVLRYVIGV